MSQARQLRLVEAKGIAPTPENVAELVDEIWTLQSRLAEVQQQAALDMRKAAVDTYKEFCVRDSFLDTDVIKALEALPLPHD